MNISIGHTFWSFWILVTLSYVQGGIISDFVGRVGMGLLQDINTITHPINSAVLTTVTKPCHTVKYLLGMNYEALEKGVKVDLDNLKVHFRTNKTRTIYNINEAAKKVTEDPHFDRKHKVLIYLHGFTGSPNATGFTIISDAFLIKGGYNILAVDGSSLIGWLYVKSSTYVRFIGEKLGEILSNLMKEGISEDNIIIVGHSLGAHIGAFACKKAYAITRKRIGRLSGLDPAAPCFTNVKDDFRLKKTDAKFVDVIHTDVGVYGITESLGHVDYYPNGGYNQPGCLLQTCSHLRAWELYASSVLHPNLFLAKKCTSWDDFKSNQCKNDDTSYMGFPSNPKSSGNYYLVTDSDAPYGLSRDGMKYTGGNSVLNRLK